MIEILRVLADETGTSPRRSALAPVAKSLRYQLAWKGAASHSSLRRFTRSRIDCLLCSGPPRTAIQARTIPRTGAPMKGPARGLDCRGPPPQSIVDGGLDADPRHDDRRGRRGRLDPLRRRTGRPRRTHRRARTDDRAPRALSRCGAGRWPGPGDPAGPRQHAHASLPRAGAGHLRGPLASPHAAVHRRPGAPAAPRAHARRGARHGATRRAGSDPQRHHAPPRGGRPDRRLRGSPGRHRPAPRPVRTRVGPCRRLHRSARAIPGRSGARGRRADSSRRFSRALAWQGRRARERRARRLGAGHVFPGLLGHLRKLQSELDALATVHLNQIWGEVAAVTEQRGVLPTEYLAREGFLSDRLVAAHCRCMTQAEEHILGASRAAVAFNAAIAARRGLSPRVADLEGAGCLITLGTDNMAEDMIEVMRTALFMERVRRQDGRRPTPEDVLTWATRNGYRALGIPDGGWLAPGNRADLIAIDLRKPHLTPALRVVSCFVHQGQVGDVEAVMVDGRWIMRDRRVLTLDEAAIVAEADRIARAAWRRLFERRPELPRPPGLDVGAR